MNQEVSRTECGHHSQTTEPLESTTTTNTTYRMTKTTPSKRIKKFFGTKRRPSSCHAPRSPHISAAIVVAGKEKRRSDRSSSPSTVSETKPSSLARRLTPSPKLDGDATSSLFLTPSTRCVDPERCHQHSRRSENNATMKTPPSTFPTAPAVQSPFHLLIQEALPLFMACQTQDEKKQVVSIVLERTMKVGAFTVLRNGVFVVAPRRATQKRVLQILETDTLRMHSVAASMVTKAPKSLRQQCSEGLSNDHPSKGGTSDGACSLRPALSPPRETTIIKQVITSMSSSSVLPLKPCLKTKVNISVHHQHHHINPLDLLCAVAVAESEGLNRC